MTESSNLTERETAVLTAIVASIEHHRKCVYGPSRQGELMKERINRAYDDSCRWEPGLFLGCYDRQERKVWMKVARSLEAKGLVRFDRGMVWVELLRPGIEAIDAIELAEAAEG